MHILIPLVAFFTLSSRGPLVVTTSKSTNSVKVTSKTTAKSASHVMSTKVSSTTKRTTATIPPKPTTISKSSSTIKPTTSATTKPTTSATTKLTTSSTTKPTTTSTTLYTTSSTATSSTLACASSTSSLAQPTGQPLSMSVTAIGTTVESDPSFSYVYGRDGGGGGTVGGQQLAIFSDTTVNGFGPITNTMVYYTINGSVMVQDFGSGGIPNQAIPYIANESSYTQAGNGQTRIAIWPTTAVVNLPGDSMRAIGVAGVSVQSAWSSGLGSYDLYNTLFTVTGGPAPSISRTVPVLFTNSTVAYGNFGTFFNPLDGLLYFFAADGTSGLKVARASTSGYTQISTWAFWNGATWQAQALTPGSSGSLLDGAFSSGDVFYSTKYRTFMAVYFLANVDSTFRYRYVLPDANGNVTLTGPWSDEFVLYDTSALVDGGFGFNYAGHVYPQNDPCGNSLTMSITRSDGITPYFFQAVMS